MKAVALALALIAALPAFAAEQMPAPQMAEDGFYHPDWFLMSFMDLKDDETEAAKAGKQLVMMVEQRGCGACKRVHEVNLRDPALTEYLKQHFNIIQIDLYGSREITDFDGQTLSEKEYARKLGVRATPTLLFYKDSPISGGSDAIAWKAVGYLEPEPFVNAFAYARQRAFTQDFIAWLNSPADKVKLR